MEKYQKYKKDSLIEFLNQEPTDDFQALWDGKDEEFWMFVAETYLGAEYEEGDIREFVMDEIKSCFKVVGITVNGKPQMQIYIYPNTSPVNVKRYACQQLLMTVEEFSQQVNSKIRYVIDNMIDWTAPDKSFVSLKYGEEQTTSHKAPKTTVEQLSDEECDEKKFRKKFGQAKRPKNADWATLYQMFSVAKTPQTDFVLGATVNAIARRVKDKDDLLYGYIIERTINTKNRPIELLIRRFNFKDEDEVWIWNGTASHGSWLNQLELNALRSDGKTASSTYYKTLSVHTKSFTPKF